MEGLAKNQAKIEKIVSILLSRRDVHIQKMMRHGTPQFDMFILHKVEKFLDLQK
jgi:hypothetical protein